MDLPSAFHQQIVSMLGGDEASSLFAAIAGDEALSIRVNASKVGVSLPYEGVPWCESAYYLADRPSFTFDPLFHAGGYYVQEASSMFVGVALRHWLAGYREGDRAGLTVLDLCAAPGGKSTLMASLLPDDALLVCNEVVRPRSQVLAENVAKWGVAAVVTNSEPAAYGQLGEMFDLVLADVPCSGEGMFRKDPQAVEEWSADAVVMCAERQRSIIADVWRSLRTGGAMIYSTCTYNIEENERNVAWICETLGAEVVALPYDAAWGITVLDHEQPHGYRFMPHKTRGEGFFLCLLRKLERGEALGNEVDTLGMEYCEGRSTERSKRRRGEDRRAGRNAPGCVAGDALPRQWVVGGEAWHWEQLGATVCCWQAVHHATVMRLRSHLRIVQCGLPVAELKGRDWMPTAALALSLWCDRSAFTIVELSYDEAISYLRREALVLGDAAMGYLLVAYRGLPLGFVKQVGQRANNLYPQEWRIRTTYRPATLPTVVP